MNWNEKTILLTGGTGSFGQKFVEVMLKKHNPKAIRIFSRDELKQWEMEKRFNSDKRLRFLIGDVRDKERLGRAMEDGVDIVVHTAALKQVPLCEYNPFEAIKTNILGAQNVIDAAIDRNIDKVIAISTDKAVNPVNLYGATKLCMEKICVAANAYVGSQRNTKISCARYGNVAGSRGSVIPLFLKQKTGGILGITDKRMTRFWITLEQGVDFVISCVEMMRGGEIFVPKVPSMKVTDLAKIIAPRAKIKYIGIRPGEKIHETLITENESGHTLEFDKFFVVCPNNPWLAFDSKHIGKSRPVREGFSYTSDSNEARLSEQELEKIIKEVK